MLYLSENRGMDAARILLVDDDLELCSSLARLLCMDGFAVECAHNAQDGERMALDETFDLVILDVMLPGGDGLRLLRRIRLHSAVPILMLTARGDEADRIAGLEGGADDYLPKPFNVRELVARLRNVLRRRTSTGPAQILRHGGLELHAGSRRVLHDGEAVELTGAEFDVLSLLVRSAGKVLSRDEIAEAALGRPIGMMDRSVDNHISNLRKKLGTHSGGVERIRNVRGQGYVYSAGGEGGNA